MLIRYKFSSAYVNLRSTARARVKRILRLILFILITYSKCTQCSFSMARFPNAHISYIPVNGVGRTIIPELGETQISIISVTNAYVSSCKGDVYSQVNYHLAEVRATFG